MRPRPFHVVVVEHDGSLSGLVVMARSLSDLCELQWEEKGRQRVPDPLARAGMRTVLAVQICPN